MNTSSSTDSAPGNVDAGEIAKFDGSASRWWDPESEFRPLHLLNPLRLDYIDARTGGLTGARVLDVGCGGGLLTEGMAARGAKVTGIDLGEQTLEVARLHALETGVDVDYERVAVEDFAADHAEAFDVVTCLEMLEHVPDPPSVVAACARLVRPGGHVIFSTLNRTPRAWALAVVGAEYVLRMLPRGTHDYERFIRPSELAAWARPHGLTPAQFRGIHYNPLLRRFRLGQDVRANYIADFRASDEGGTNPAR